MSDEKDKKKKKKVKEKTEDTSMQFMPATSVGVNERNAYGMEERASSFMQELN